MTRRRSRHAEVLTRGGVSRSVLTGFSHLLAQSMPRLTISLASGTSKSFATWPQGAVEHASFAPLYLPDDGYYVALDPGYVLSGEGGGRQDLVGGVHVHVVLLGVHAEVFQA